MAPNTQTVIKEKPKKKLLRLDEKTLFYNENGMKKLYEFVMKNDFKETTSDVNILTNFTNFLGKKFK